MVMLSFHDFGFSFLEEMTEYKNTLLPLQGVIAIIRSTVEARKFLL